MQGLPTQLFTKATKAHRADGSAKAQSKSGLGVVDAEESSNQGDFLSLLSSLGGGDKGLLKTALNKEGQPENHQTEVDASNIKLEKKLANTSGKLDQLLNQLKGTEDENASGVEGSEKENLKSFFPNNKKIHPELNSAEKTDNPLEFIVKGSKENSLGLIPEAKDDSKTELESLMGKKVQTGEDYLKNLESVDKKNNTKLSLIQGQKSDLASSITLPKQSVKAYGQGQNILNDNVIKNTKDLAFKDKKSNIGLDELKSPETKVGAQLANLKSEVIPSVMPKENASNQLQAQTEHKVLDLSKLNASNTNEIIKKISDYVEQNTVANKQSLDLTVKHDSLGEFKIQVSKAPSAQSNLIDLQITTSSKEGHDFFVKNEVSLIKNLNQSGVNLSDLRIISHSSESSLLGQSDSRQSSSFHQGNDGYSSQQSSFESSFSTDSDSGSQKRKQLWQEYQERYGA
jgi:hypothetical protein